MSSNRSLTIAAAQTGPVLLDDMRPGIDAACGMLEEAAGKGAEVICFSELFLSPFFPNRLVSDSARWFLTLPNPVVQPLFDLAKRHTMAMIFPYGEHDGPYFYNAATVADRKGRILGTYRKTHIPAVLPSSKQGGTGSYEKFYFTPGRALPVFELDGIKIGIQICYDRKFPEGSRVLALQEAQVIFMPICAASYGETKLRDNAWDLPLRARAYENGTFVVAVNRAGDEAGRHHLGRSMIISPIGGEIMAEACEDKPELLVVKVDLGEVATAQTSLPWWRDRRPELYGTLAGT
jgi:predicted amidohydrolase